MTAKSRGHCNNIKVFNQGKSNQIREKSGNLIAKNVWPPCLDIFFRALYKEIFSYNFGIMSVNPLLPGNP